MNANKVCLYSEVIHFSPDDQRSAPPNICVGSAGSGSPHSSSIDEGLRSSCLKQRRGYQVLSEHCTALQRSRMATAASMRSQSVKITEQARSRTAQSLALPCPSNVVRVCVAGTKYSVGKLEKQLQYNTTVQLW